MNTWHVRSHFGSSALAFGYRGPNLFSAISSLAWSFRSFFGSLTMLLRTAMQIHFIGDSALYCKNAKKKISAYKHEIMNVLWQSGNAVEPRYQYASGGTIADIAAMIMQSPPSEVGVIVIMGNDFIDNKWKEACDGISDEWICTSWASWSRDSIQISARFSSSVRAF